MLWIFKEEFRLLDSLLNFLQECTFILKHSEHILAKNKACVKGAKQDLLSTDCRQKNQASKANTSGSIQKQMKNCLLIKIL